MIHYKTNHFPHTAPILHSQAVRLTSSAVIEDGGALWVLGGRDKDLYVQSHTQIVRPGQPTVWGPDLTEETEFHCSSTLEDNTLMVTGGARKSNPDGSARTEVYSFTTQQWTRRADMNQRRMSHSCSTVWLDKSFDYVNGLIDMGGVTNSSVLSVMVAGGKFFYFHQLGPTGPSWS